MRTGGAEQCRRRVMERLAERRRVRRLAASAAVEVDPTTRLPVKPLERGAPVCPAEAVTMRVEIRETSAQRGRRGAVTAALRTRALFVMSKFCIRANVVHAWRPEDDALEFALDARSTNVVIKEAAGFWHVEEAPEDRGPGWVRVWLSAHVRISRAVPGKVVDYAASRALPRATVWLQELLSR